MNGPRTFEQWSREDQKRFASRDNRGDHLQVEHQPDTAETALPADAPVRQGQPMVEIYGPTLITAQEEHLQAMQTARELEDLHPEI